MENEIYSYSKIATHEELKNALRHELNAAAVSFVRIGYLLKTARDTDILGDQYADVNDFAQKEFGMDKSQVSRFININDRFSIGGYSEHLQDRYEGYGSSKLSMMLLLPDSINEQLSPEYSKSDIQTIKEEYQAEQKISDIEVMLEEPAPQPETENDEFLTLIIRELIEEHPDPAKTIKFGMNHDLTIKDTDVSDSYMRDGDSAFNIRISGMGRFLISCKASGVVISNMRSGENSPVSWEEFKDILVAELETKDWEEPKVEVKPKKKVEKSRSTGVNTHKNDKKASTEQKEEVKMPENNVISPVESTSEDKNEEVAPVQPQEDEKNTEINEAAGPDWYGKYMFETRTQRMTSSELIKSISDKNRLVHDVPPITRALLSDLILDARALIAQLEHLENVWKYYETREEEE